MPVQPTQGTHLQRRARPRRGSGAAGNRPRTIAALDLGTNNCRLLIAKPVCGGFEVVDGFSRIVRLGQGLVETGELCEVAMSRTIEALSICAAKVRRRRVHRARYVATEAARQAANCAGFLARVENATGIALEIISSREEAELTLMGCLPLLDPSVPYAVIFDVGGGSAEIVWLRLHKDSPPHILDWMSLPVGVVTVTERHGGSDFTDAEYEATLTEVQEQLRPFEQRHEIRRHLEKGQAQMLGTAGTVTTVASVNMGLKRYNRAVVDGSYLNLSDVHAVCRSLSRSTYDQRIEHPSIGPGRADLVVAGCAILEAICRTWPAGRLRVADRGVREGILLDLAASIERERQDGRA